MSRRSVKDTSPIIFIHYGSAAYLGRSLRCAARANSENRIILLGDDANRSSACGLGDFFDYRALSNSPQAITFNNVFEPVQGNCHRFNKAEGMHKWLKFVFLRWFIICEFLRREHIDRFWIFDSDTLILAPLGPRERRFSAYESTAQCRDCCLNGFVASRVLVERYTLCILELFKDKEYLATQRERLKKQAGLAFNEMDAFCEFRRRENVTTFHAAQPLEGEFLDDALAYDANFEASPHKINGRITVKRLWKDRHGALYARHLKSSRYVRMLTCNLSWLPDYVGKKLARFCLTPEQDAKVAGPSET